MRFGIKNGLLYFGTEKMMLKLGKPQPPLVIRPPQQFNGTLADVLNGVANTKYTLYLKDENGQLSYLSLVQRSSFVNGRTCLTMEWRRDGIPTPEMQYENVYDEFTASGMRTLVDCVDFLRNE